mmetsp:Transcript_6679/g.28486  ORF Transcript_6679/g.28486 Transcript_6679/m.28486 type:complete len:136 (-) Transcript_6679:3775-4182(-)
MSAERPAAASRRDVLLGIAGTIGVALGSSQPTLAAEGLAGKVDPYQDAQKGFKILKPSGWNEFSASENFDVKWQDIINPVEQITVITTPVTKGKTVADIGTSEVRLRLRHGRLDLRLLCFSICLRQDLGEILLHI